MIAAETGLAQNVEQVLARMRQAASRAGRRAEDIQLLAVSKTVTVPAMLEVIQAGVKALGENRVQEARAKWPQIETQMRWHGCEYHLVGHLQTNKAKEAVNLFDLIHALDSERLAREINQRAWESGKIQRVLIEVNTSSELTKFGVEPEEVKKMISVVQAYKNLRLEGLMTVGPLTGGLEGARQAFRRLRELRDEAGGQQLLPTLSMGMTQDFEVAIAEGATLVRVGTAIFGERM